MFFMASSVESTIYSVEVRSCFWRRMFCCLLLSLSLMLSGCVEEIYSNLEEDDANEMLAALISNSIPAEKVNNGKDGFSVHVDSYHMLRAISVLKDSGFPKRKRDSIATTFKKSGIISSPFEERVRYIYALGEYVAETLSRIDGVLTSRVHVVLPENRQPGQEVKPSSASVFIRYRSGFDLEFFVPQIRRLVASAIEGLSYSAVTVVLKEAVPSSAGDDIGKGEYNFLGLSVRMEQRWRLLVFVWAAISGLVVLTVCCCVLFYLFINEKRRKVVDDEGFGVPSPPLAASQVESA